MRVLRADAAVKGRANELRRLWKDYKRKARTSDQKAGRDLYGRDDLPRVDRPAGEMLMARLTFTDDRHAFTGQRGLENPGLCCHLNSVAATALRHG
jgi:hypothetical protein